MAKGCRMVIIHLSCVLKKLCAKIADPRTMDDFKHDTKHLISKVVISSSHSGTTRKKFPPFFDTVMHLLVHLVEE
jgi:hypothetical protein